METSLRTYTMRFLSLLLVFKLALCSQAEVLTETRSSEVKHDQNSQSESLPKNNSSERTRPTSMDDICTLYMAPSTIPGAGLGVFSSVGLGQGEEIDLGEVVVPVMKIAQDIPVLNQYLYTGRYVQDPKASAFIIGMGSIMNSHLGLVNVGLVGPLQEDLEREHPSHGSLSNFHDMRYQVMFDLPQGAELFGFYGNHWFDLRPELDHVPRTTDYYTAEEMIQSFLPSNTSDQGILQQNLNDLLEALPVNSRIRSLIPQDPQKAHRMATVGLRSVLQDDHLAPVTRLVQKGRCLNNIISKDSGLLYAGKGAFSKVDISEGSVITGSPLIHLTDGTKWLDLHHQKWNPSTQQYERRQENVAQLLFNYCFGHPRSTLLLCPYGNVALINHNHQTPNVRIQWSPNEDINHNSSVLELSLADLQGIQRPSLAIDYVALRDIEAGEELVIDYGEAWEAAWRSHVHQWQPIPERSAHDFNIEGPMVIRTEDEQEETPYPPNIEFRCHPDALHALFLDDHVDWFDAFGRPIGLPCQILSRRIIRGNIVYAVRVQVAEDEWRVIENVGRQHIRFADVPHQLHHEKAFRHPMHLPDDMFPQQWRNIA